nr:hypothetical protein [uncultured Bacteroides sp.]
MKKKYLIYLFVFLLMGCNKSDLLVEQEAINTRSVFQGGITGPQTPEIGRVVSYKCIMDSAVTENNYELTVKASASGKVRLSEGTDFSKETINIKVIPGETVFFFNAIWLEKSEATSGIRLSINYGSNIIGQIDVNPTDAKLKIANSGSFLIGGEITVTATPQDFGEISGNPVWSYDKQNFSLVKSEKSSSSCYITLKAMTDVTSSPISVNVPVTYTYSSLTKQTTAIGNTSIKINSPFGITSETKFMCPDGNIIANMPKLGNVSGATVNWISGAGLTVVTGQGTGTATFQAASSANGYTSIEAKTTYNGKTYSSKIDSIWVGKPIIINTTDQFTIGDRDKEVYIANPRVLGSNQKISWRLLSGQASIREAYSGGIYVKSLASFNESETIKVAADASNTCGRTSEICEIQVVETAEPRVNVRLIFTYIGNGNGGSGDIFIDREQGDETLYKELESNGMESVWALTLPSGKYTIIGRGTPENSLNQSFNINRDDFLSYYNTLQISIEIDDRNWHIMTSKKAY